MNCKENFFDVGESPTGGSGRTADLIFRTDSESQGGPTGRCHHNAGENPV